MLKTSITLLLVASTLVGCSSPNAFQANKAVLAAAETDISEGRIEQASGRLETLLTETSAEANTYAVQRFYAAYLLTRAHGEASFRNAFLTEARAGGSFNLSGGGSSGSQAASPVGHLVAVTWWASFGRKWFAAASRASLDQGGESLLPANLADLSPENAHAHLLLSFLAVYSRLNFQDRTVAMLNDLRELSDLDRCNALLAEARVPQQMHPWIYRAIYRYLKKSDEPAAYRFGVMARRTAKFTTDTLGYFDKPMQAEIADWIAGQSRFTYRCPRGDTDFEPDLERCDEHGIDQIDYEARPK